MANLVLDNDKIAEEYFENTRLLGIQCSADASRFVWLINKHLGFDFRYKDESEIELNKRGRRLVFPLFEFSETHIDINHLIYTNQFDGEYLLPELKHTDFLWLVRFGGAEADFMSVLTAEIRKIESVQLVTPLANDKIKNKQILVV